MTPTTIEATLALIDLSITGYEAGLRLLARLREQGLITAEQQQEKLNRIRDIRAEVGLPPAPGGVGETP